MRRALGRLARAMRTHAGTKVAAAVLAIGLVIAVGYAIRSDRAEPLTTVTPNGSSTPYSSVPSTAVAIPSTPSPPTTPIPSATATAAATSAPTTAIPTAPPAATTSKKGVSTWNWPGNREALGAVGASWFYNWSPSDDQTPGPDGVEFVPMIWGAGAVTDSALATARANGSVLLGFNEPDLAEQANMTVEQALALWPRLEATGMRLGSPAPAYGGADPGGWLDRFMTGARERGYRVDFIALHWYGSDFSPAAVGHLRGYLQAVYDRYRLPIWLTEYALMSFSGGVRYPTEQQQVDFIVASTQMLESLPFVERYAWFALPATDDSPTGLYRAGSGPTAAGQAYRRAGG